MPDYRGIFLRGYGVFFEGETEEEKIASEDLGIIQQMAVGEHDHIVSIRNGDGGGCCTPAFDVTDSPWGYVDHRTKPGNNMSVETRPVNTAVKYFIRAIG